MCPAIPTWRTGLRLTVLPAMRRLRRIGRVLEVVHPRAVLAFTTIAATVAVIAQWGTPLLRNTVTLASAMALIQIAIGIFNEYCDRELDALCKPERPIPAGLVSARQACWATWASLSLGLAVSATVSLAGMLVLAFAAFTGILYSAHLKRSKLSWLPYAIAYPVVPIWVWVSLGDFRPSMLLVYPAAIPFSVGVHLCNQLRDYDEDAEQGARGFVHYLGKGTAGKMCVGSLLIGPILAMATTLGAGSGTVVLLAFALFHCLSVAPCLGTEEGRPGSERWGAIFRRLQFSGPLMLIGWVLAFSAS